MTAATVDSTWVLRERALARAGQRLNTTPGRMRLAGAAIVAALVVLAVVGGAAIRARQHASAEVSGHDETLLVSAETAYTSLAGADATATNTFLEAGLEPPAQRQAYLDHLSAAAKALSTLATGAGSSAEVQHALAVIDTELPVYTGMVESARANNRQGYPVGAAYLSEGSSLMQNQILPAVGQLYRVEAERLNQAYGSGQSVADVAGVVVFVLVALGLLVVAQLFVAGRTNRLLNPLMAVATLLTVVLALWTLVAFAASASRLDSARRRGSDPVEVTSAAEILVSRAQVDVNLALASRGSEPQHLADLGAVDAALSSTNGTSGLLAEAQRYDPVAAEALGNSYAAYHDVEQSVTTAATSGQYTKAVTQATGGSPDDLVPAANQLQSALDLVGGAGQKAFTAEARSAARALSALSLTLIGVVVAAMLVLMGLERRISEYR